MKKGRLNTMKPMEPTVEEIVTETISSVEISEMMEIRHADLIAKVEKISKDFNERKISLVDYWIEGTYLDKKGESRKCYNITKIGCDFLAHKMQGKKGNIFTARYIQKFEKMKNKLNSGTDDFKKLSPTTQAIINIELNQQKQEKQIREVKEEFTNFKDNAPLFNIECEELVDEVKRTRTRVLGGYKSPAYNNKSIRTKVFQDVYGEIKRQFGVRKYKAIKRKDLDGALEILSSYELPKILKSEIMVTNNQLKIGD